MATPTQPVQYKLKNPLVIGRGSWGRTIERTLIGMGLPPPWCIGHEVNLAALNRSTFDSLIIATPVSTHYELMRWGREWNLPMFVEKPIVESVERMEHLEQLWMVEPSPPVLCDFTYCWSPGFEHVSKMGKSDNNNVITAAFGGDVRRPDCSMLWDYGAHVVAMALELGFSSAQLRAALVQHDSRTIVSAQNFRLDVLHSEDRLRDFLLINPTMRAHLRGTSWRIQENGKDAVFYDDAKENPLKRALTSFLNLDIDSRWGLTLPGEVTRVLESWGKCN